MIRLGNCVSEIQGHGVRDHLRMLQAGAESNHWRKPVVRAFWPPLRIPSVGAVARSAGVGFHSATHTRFVGYGPKTPLKFPMSPVHTPLVQGGTLFSSNMALPRGMKNSSEPPTAHAVDLPQSLSSTTGLRQWLDSTIRCNATYRVCIRLKLGPRSSESVVEPELPCPARKLS